MDTHDIILIVIFNVISILSIGQDIFFFFLIKAYISKETYDTTPINTILVFILTFLFFLIMPLNFIFDFCPKLFDWPSSYVCLSLGSVISFVGLLVRLLATYTLSEAHSIKIQIQENQKLHQEGLYKFIRHPIYFGLLLTVSGISLIFQNLFMLSIGLLIYSCVIFIRFKKEEKLLIHHFGKDYLAYMKKTKAIIPFIY